MSGGRHSLKNPTNPSQGTAFHELIVAPTFTPDLARPYHVPGTNTIINPFPLGAGTLQDAPLATAAQSEASLPSENQAADTEEPRLIYTHVTLEWTERPKSICSTARPRKQQESKLVSRAVDIFSLSQVDFIPVMLDAHGYENKRKGKSDRCLLDADWQIILQKLTDAVKCSSKLDTVCVVFDLDTMEGFLQWSKRLHSPDPYESELSFGTHVPNTENYNPAQIALGSAIDDIKAAHSCKEHGTCFINGDLQHCFRLNMWGQAIASTHFCGSHICFQLETVWSFGAPSPHTLLSSPSDTATLLLTSMVPVVAMMVQNMAGNIPRTAGPAPIAPPSAPASPVCASSPPPAIEDELDVFMNAFRCAKNLKDAIIDDTRAGLHRAHYSPDVLSETSVTIECLQELTGLQEREVHQLKKFAGQWSGKMDGKRARHGINF
ncbi:hypothetical protein B0H10DRAFT_2214248 [Mycena sp. CBHHK59/15]|nr:hypothetical protein B0H10DRAFT_2214248 [Mycena sp. CBHHK59/15]